MNKPKNNLVRLSTERLRFILPKVLFYKSHVREEIREGHKRVLIYLAPFLTHTFVSGKCYVVHSTQPCSATSPSSR